MVLPLDVFFFFFLFFLQLFILKTQQIFQDCGKYRSDSNFKILIFVKEEKFFKKPIKRTDK